MLTCRATKRCAHRSKWTFRSKRDLEEHCSRNTIRLLLLSSCTYVAPQLKSSARFTAGMPICRRSALSIPNDNIVLALNYQRLHCTRFGFWRWRFPRRHRRRSAARRCKDSVSNTRFFQVSWYAERKPPPKCLSS